MTRDELIDSYRSYGAVVYRRCRQLLANEQDSRDASQEVFERCLRHCAELRPGPELLAWLYRVSTNLCLDRLRHGRAAQDARQEATQGELPSLAAEEETRLLHRDSVRRLLAAVERRTREVAIYLYVDGMTQEEIAHVCGMTDRSVRNHLSRLREIAVHMGLHEASGESP